MYKPKFPGVLRFPRYSNQEEEKLKHTDQAALTMEQIKELHDAFEELLNEVGGFIILGIHTQWHDETNEVALVVSGDDGVEHIRILGSFRGEPGADAALAFIQAGGFPSDDFLLLTKADFKDKSRISVSELRDLARRKRGCHKIK